MLFAGWVHEPTFTFSYEMNTDNWAGIRPQRELIFSVKARDILGRLSALPTQIVVRNPPPDPISYMGQVYQAELGRHVPVLMSSTRVFRGNTRSPWTA